MIELLILVAGVLALWKFASSLNGVATAARIQAEVFSEKISIDAVEERTRIYEEFKDNMGEKQIYSHEDIMSALKVD